MHFALFLFLQLVFIKFIKQQRAKSHLQVAKTMIKILIIIVLHVFSCSFYISCLSYAGRRQTEEIRVHKYKEIIERHLRSFIRHFLSTLLKINMMYLVACFQCRCVV